MAAYLSSCAIILNSHGALLVVSLPDSFIPIAHTLLQCEIRIKTRSREAKEETYLDEVQQC